MATGRRSRLRLVPRRRCCHYQAMVDVTVEARNDVDSPGLVKLQGETWELNIWATTDELWTLAGIEKTDWAQRRTLKVGTCARTRPVWWDELTGHTGYPAALLAPRSSRDHRTQIQY